MSLNMFSNHRYSTVFFTLFVTPVLAEVADNEKVMETIEVVAKSGNTGGIEQSKTIAELDDFLALPIDKVEDVAAYVPSVFASTANAGMETGLLIRGFTVGAKNIYLNGHLDNQRMYKRMPETVEKITIEKGHSSIFYGSGAPGGSLIYHSKKPYDAAQTQLSATVGSFDKYKLALDSSGAITDDIDYRAVLVKQQANSFIKHAKDDQDTIYTHLAWQVSSKQQLALEVEYNKLTNPWTFGIVRIDDEILFDKSYVYPATESNREYLRTSLYWDYAISDKSQLSVKLNQVDLTRDDIWMGFYYKMANDQLMGYWADIDNKAKQHNIVVNFAQQIDFSWASHYFNFGYNYNQYDNTQHMDRSIGTFFIDPFAPDYSIAEPTEINSIRAFSSDESESSFYLLDTIHFTEQLQLSLGVRSSTFKIVDLKDNSIAVDKQATTSFVGAAYQLSDAVRLYSNLSQSYQPNVGVDKQQNYFEPKKAEQVELALEYNINPSHQITGALYQITQSNLLTRDPDDPDFKKLAGSIKSQGIELTIVNQIAEQWLLNTSVSYLENTLDNHLSPHHGNTAANLPRNSFSSRLQWQHPSDSFGAHIGVFALSSRYGDNANSFSVAGYGRVDMGGFYHIDDWQFSLNIENLFDKRYIVTSNYEDDMYPGRTRDIRFTVSYQW